ncbi:N-acetyltransferase [Microbacterium sp. dk485]|uniref:GNAT family N-acetyltransferase n=1 Tax=Microbacterium sp. dk485 TaxID=2560021 RepID=UPI0010731789|nr:GNAT family N-acetyltransferase [Microbacterium sp. dk485]TFV82108.1 N-acetyltransferase [Microbacterium sp. dk485]
MHPTEPPLSAEADDVALAHAVERNTAELLLRMGDAGGGHRRRDDEVSWTLGGSPLDYHNAVVAAQLVDPSVDAVIMESRERLRRARVPGTWHVGPSMRPDDLPARLARAGFDPDGQEPGMAARLDHIPVQPTTGLDVQVVREVGDLEEWISAMGSGFGEGLREAEWVGEMFLRIGLDRPDLRHLLVRRDGRAVGTATVLIAAGVGGLYFVMTVPDVRRQGIGAEITRAAMRLVRDAGMNHAVLTSSAMGRSLYQSIGFRQVCTIRLFTWRPG